MLRLLTLRHLAAALALLGAWGYGARENLYFTPDQRAGWAGGCLLVVVLALAISGSRNARNETGRR